MIDWMAFVTVAVSSLVSACLAVSLFALALRVGEGEGAWRRPLSVGLFALCGVGVLFGIYLIVGDHIVTLFTR